MQQARGRRKSARKLFSREGIPGRAGLGLGRRGEEGSAPGGLGHPVSLRRAPSEVDAGSDGAGELARGEGRDCDEDPLGRFFHAAPYSQKPFSPHRVSFPRRRRQHPRGDSPPRVASARSAESSRRAVVGAPCGICVCSRSRSHRVHIPSPLFSSPGPRPRCRPPPFPRSWSSGPTASRASRWCAAPSGRARAVNKHTWPRLAPIFWHSPFCASPALPRAAPHRALGPLRPVYGQGGHLQLPDAGRRPVL